jgi:hypothetical protein
MLVKRIWSMTKRQSRAGRRASLLVATLAIGLMPQVIFSGTPASASGVGIKAIVPNEYLRVYHCSRWTGDCRYEYTYLANGPYDPSVPNQYSNVYQWSWLNF